MFVWKCGFSNKGIQMAFFWVEFDGRTSGTIEARTIGEATEIGGRFGIVKVANTLPYPAEPVLHQVESSCPPFCWTPEQCKHRSCCPKSYACSE